MTTTKTTKKTSVKAATAKVAKPTPETHVIAKETTSVLGALVAPEVIQAVSKPEVTPELSIAAEVAKPAPKKANPKPKTVKKAPDVEPESIAPTPEISIHERVGLTAGDIWQYLAANGVTTVAMLVDKLPEDEEIIQRSIGWLAQEDKITLLVVDQIESIELKG